MKRRDFLGRLIGTLGFGIFSSKSCIDYLQAREPERKVYVDVICSIKNKHHYLDIATSLPDGCVNVTWLSPGSEKGIYTGVILKFERDAFMTHKVEDYRRCGLEIIDVPKYYIEYV